MADNLWRPHLFITHRRKYVKAHQTPSGYEPSVRGMKSQSSSLNTTIIIIKVVYAWDKKRLSISKNSYFWQTVNLS